MPTLRSLILFALALLFVASATAQEESVIVLSDSASVTTIQSKESLLLTFVLTPETEAGIQFEASDSLIIQTLTHPKSDVQIVEGKLSARCPGLRPGHARGSAVVRIHNASLTTRSKKDPVMNTLVFHNPHAQPVQLRYEPFGQTQRLMIVGVHQSE